MGACPLNLIADTNCFRANPAVGDEGYKGFPPSAVAETSKLLIFFFTLELDIDLSLFIILLAMSGPIVTS